MSKHDKLSWFERFCISLNAFPLNFQLYSVQYSTVWNSIWRVVLHFFPPLFFMSVSHVDFTPVGFPNFARSFADFDEEIFSSALSAFVGVFSNVTAR